MTPRDRVLVALAHQLPDVVPAYVRNVIGWERHAAYLGAVTLTELMQRLGNTILSFSPTYLASDPPASAAEHSPGLPPIWGFAGDMEPYTYSDTLPRPLAHAQTAADVEAFAWPSGSAQAWDFARLRAQLATETRHARLSPSWTPFFSQLCGLFGMEQAMINLHWNRAVVEAALAHLDDFYTQFFQNLLGTCGDQLDIFGLGDDFAGSRGLLIRPEMWRQLLKPRYARWIGMAKARSLPTLLHSCGVVLEVLPDLIEIGLDAWQTVQTHLPGQDAAQIKRRFGKHLTFVGGIDTTNVLSFASPEEIRRHVERQILALGEAGGYICAPDHTIMEEVPPENVSALYRAVADFRRPGYTLAPSSDGDAWHDPGNRSSA